MVILSIIRFLSSFGGPIYLGSKSRQRGCLDLNCVCFSLHLIYQFDWRSNAWRAKYLYNIFLLYISLHCPQIQTNKQKNNGQDWCALIFEIKIHNDLTEANPSAVKQPQHSRMYCFDLGPKYLGLQEELRKLIVLKTTILTYIFQRNI